MALPLLGALAWSGRLDRTLTARNHPSVVATRDSPYGRVTVAEASGQISVFENDALAFESEGTAAEEFAHLAALQRPAPRRVLVLGGGVEGLVRELLQHRPERIDYVELNPVLLRLLRPHLPPDIARSLRAGPVRVVVADPRRFLDDAGQYDLIVVGMPEPESGQTNRFYTREFFARCAERLGPEGVLAFRLRGAENLWTPQQTRRAGSIHRALRQVFRDTVVLPGVINVVLASDRPLERDPDTLGRRLVDRGLRTRLVIPAYLEYLYTNDRFGEIAGLLEESRVPPNSDLRPVCYQYTLLLWLSRFYPAAALPDLPDLAPRALLRSPPAWIVLAALALTMLAARRRALPRRVLLAGVAGFAGMVLETVLILNYQVNRGVLYQDLGLLLTAFMTGLAAGSSVMAACARRWERGWLASAWPGRLLLLSLACLALGTGWLIEAYAVVGLATTASLLLVVGLLVAAVFCHASLHGQPDQRRVVAPLYSADLLGGALGSLLASLLLIPAGGLAAAGLAAAVTTLLALLLA
jgi:spermidine synthase